MSGYFRGSAMEAAAAAAEMTVEHGALKREVAQRWSGYWKRAFRAARSAGQTAQHELAKANLRIVSLGMKNAKLREATTALVDQNEQLRREKQALVHALEKEQAKRQTDRDDVKRAIDTLNKFVAGRT